MGRISGVTMSCEDPLMYLPRKAVQVFIKGQFVYDCQQPSKYLYVVIQGRVKISNTAGDGSQTITGIVSVEGMFGESCLVASCQRNETAVALDNITLMAWTPDEIEQKIEQDPRLGLALSQYLVRKSIELQNRIESMAVNSTPERVMLAMVQLANDLGMTTADGAVRVPSLTHSMIAEYIGTSREIVTLQMNRLRRLGMLQYSRKHIDIYLDAMKEDLRQHGIRLPGAACGMWHSAA
jgi:CRP/FNR family cyclic AMP-dependent transcriptional regulator